MTLRFKRSRFFARILPEAAVVLFLTFLTLNRLGAADVCGGSEAAMAVYAQQMIERKQYLFPLDNCSIPMYKPPLYHWTATALAFLLDQAAATPFILRLPSALYGIAGAILTMVFAAKIMSRRAAILAGLILCGSYQYISQARIGLVDMTLTFFETLALYAFFGWFSLTGNAPEDRPRRTWLHYACAIAMGLAVLAKGPVGAILPGIAILLLVVTEKRWNSLKELLKIGPLLLGAAIASSWYTACLLGHRLDFLSLQIGSENFGRFFGSLGNMPPWYYLQPLLLNSLPFSLFVPLAVLSALRRSRKRPVSSAKCSPSTAPRPDLAALGARLLAIFWLCTVAFFELASYKRRAYLLPLWPACAVLLAWWTLKWIVPGLGYARGVFIYRAAVAVCVVLASANFLFIPAYEMHNCGVPFTLRALFRWPSAGFADESSIYSFQTESYRGAAAEINRLTQFDEPLYEVGIQDALEPLVFYLGRCVRPLRSLITPPAGYTVVTEKVWDKAGKRGSGLIPLGRIPYDRDDLIVLRSSPGAQPSTDQPLP